MNPDSINPEGGFASERVSPDRKSPSTPQSTEADCLPMIQGAPDCTGQGRKQRGFDAAPLPLLAIRGDSEILEANAAAAVWLNMGSSLETPVHLEHLLPEAERGAFRSFVEEVQKASRTCRCELRFPQAGSRDELIELRGVFCEENQEIWISAVNRREIITPDDEMMRSVSAFENLSSAIVLTSPAGLIQWANTAFVQMTGYRLEEVINLRPGEFLQGPGTDPSTVAEMRAGLMSGSPFQVEILNYNKSGEGYWVQLKVNPVRDPSGDLTHFIAVQTDISKRKFAELKLAKLERFNRAILENIPGLVAVWSRDLHCEYANRAYRKWFGVSEESLAGVPMPEVLGLKLFQQNESFINYALDGHSQTFEQDIQLASGESRSTWTQYVPRANGDKPDGFLVLVTDVTLLKRAERAVQNSNNRLCRILETMQAGLIISDAGGFITEANAAAGRILDLACDEIVGRSSLDLTWRCVKENGARFPGDEHPAMVSLRTGRPVHDVVMGVGIKDNSLRWITINSTPLNGPDGLQGSVTIFSDITGFKQGEERYRKAKDAAEAATVAKARFLANMSHELRTPMNGLLGFTQLLKTTEQTAEQAEYTESMRQSGEALLTLIQDILEYSRLEAGRLEVERRRFDLRATIQEVMTLSAYRAREKELKLILDGSPESPVDAFADPGRVRQVLLNLIGNAVKFTQHGEIKIATAPGEAGFVRVLIADTGIGVALDKQALLFQAFSQVDSSTTRNYGGTGLGLALCRQFVERMGGRIGFFSNADGGATFWFTLPQSPPGGI